MPDFDLHPTTYTVAEYCQMFKRRELTVNRKYQRSDKVWPLAAQSFLIETILLGYPIPKLSLHQVTDVKTRKTTKEIVDGQQRTKAITAFYDGNLRLSRTLRLKEAAGCTYQDLTDELRQAFLDYPVQADVFTGATPDQIREVFRRMNSYTVPLNPEEQRHAVWQGEMKWFIYSLSSEYDSIFLNVGTFTEKALARMADAKLFAETTHALLEGVSTTNSRKLDSLYREFDENFPAQDSLRQRFDASIGVLLQLEDIHNGPLMKPYMMYSLLLAITHVLDPVEHFEQIVPLPLGIARKVDWWQAAARLSNLAEALQENSDAESEYNEFVRASESRTNVKEQRETRIRLLATTLLGE